MSLAPVGIGADVDDAPRLERVALPRLLPHALLGLSLVVMMLSRGTALLGDPDSQWHPAVGRWILDHRAVPRVDLFSYTFAGAPWIAKEWVSQVILALVQAAGGWTGMVLATALVLAASFVWMFDWLSRRMRFVPALAITLAAVAMMQSHMLARPHVLVVPIVIGWMIVLVGAAERGKAPSPWAALLMVAWTNMHGSFPFGLVMAGLLAGEGVLAAPREERIARALRWAAFLALATASTMASPFGLGALLVPLTMFGNEGTMTIVHEWRPIVLDEIGILAIVVLVATMAALFWDVRRNAFRILAAGLVGYLMIRHVRFVDMFGLVAPILVARTLGETLPRSEGPAFASAQARALSLAAVAALFAIAGVLTATNRWAPPPSVAPHAALAAARAAGVRGPVFNDYNFGGFLIAEGVPTYVDGRSDQLFLDDFLPAIETAVDAPDDARLIALLDKAGAGWAIVRSDPRYTDHFARLAGWRRLFADETASVYARSP